MFDRAYSGNRNTGFINIDAEQLKDMIRNKQNITIIDVCEPYEYNAKKIEGAKNIPLRELGIKITTGELDFDKESTVILYCAHGIRSRFAAAALSKAGYKNVMSLSGGIETYNKPG